MPTINFLYDIPIHNGIQTTSRRESRNLYAWNGTLGCVYLEISPVYFIFIFNFSLRKIIIHSDGFSTYMHMRRLCVREWERLYYLQALHFENTLWTILRHIITHRTTTNKRRNTKAIASFCIPNPCALCVCVCLCATRTHSYRTPPVWTHNKQQTASCMIMWSKLLSARSPKRIRTDDKKTRFNINI